MAGLCLALLSVGCGRVGYDARLGPGSTLDGSLTVEAGLRFEGGSLDGGRRDDAASIVPDAGDGGNLGCVPSPIVTLASGNSADWPSIAWDGQGFGLTWSADVAGQSEVWFARVDPVGTRTTEPVQVSSALGEVAFRPDIASDGSNFGVVWEADDEVYVAVVAPGGTVVSAEQPFSSSPGNESSRAAIVWTGDDYAVTWKDDRTGLFEIYYAAVTASGVPGSEVRVSSSAGQSQQPDVAASADRIVIVYQDNVLGTNHIYARVLDASGSPLAPAVRVSPDTHPGTLPAAAYNGSRFAVAWGTSGTTDVAWVDLDADDGAAERAPLTLNQPSRDGTVPALTAWEASFFGVWPDELATLPELSYRLVRDDGSLDTLGRAATDEEGVGLVAAAGGTVGVGVVWNAPGPQAIRFAYVCP